MPVIRVLRKRSLFTDPAGWAEDYLGPKNGYRSFQAVCVLGGVLCCTAIWLLASRLSAGFAEVWHLYLTAVLFPTIVPLVFLRAAHAATVRSMASKPTSGLAV